MITTTITDGVLNACKSAYNENCNVPCLHYGILAAILEYDKRVCKPLREELIFNEQRNIAAWRAFEEEKNQEIGRIRKQRDAALKRVEELENEDPRDSHHCACRFSDEDRRLLQECDTHNLLRVSHDLLQKNKANYDVWFKKEAEQHQRINNYGGNALHSTTLISELKAQIERATEILKAYRATGQSGALMASMIEHDLECAREAYETNNVDGIIYWEKILSELKQ